MDVMNGSVAEESLAKALWKSVDMAPFMWTYSKQLSVSTRRV